jgi:16S rRNA (uracil1498-N3)-methyltransferase
LAEDSLRALYLPVDWNEQVTVKDEPFHHLINVLHLSLGDSVLLLDGRGRSAEASIIEVTKREIVLTVDKVSSAPLPEALDVAIAVPKKDALENMLKMTVELSVRRVWLLRGEHSPERLPDFHRISALLQSSLEQSNNHWLPEVRLVSGWDDLPWSDYAHVLAFDLAGQTAPAWKPRSDDSILTLIGPEGGFSQGEKATWPEVRMVKLETSIMRAPTALACAWGWVLARRVS